MADANNRYQDQENQNPTRIREMMKESGHEFSPPQESEKYSESENQSSTRIRDMLGGKEPQEISPEPELENENEND